MLILQPDCMGANLESVPVPVPGLRAGLFQIEIIILTLICFDKDLKNSQLKNAENSDCHILST